MPSSPMFTTRPARISDVSDILALWHDAGAEPTHTDSVQCLNRLIAHDPAATIVATWDGRIVGTVIAGWDGWRGSIYRLAVDRDHRRKGLATQLLTAAERRLSAAGAVRLQAVVVGSDPRATGFWRASGWDEQRARVRFVRG